MVITKEMFDSVQGLTIKTDQPFVNPKTMSNRNAILKQASVRSSLKNIIVPIYFSEDIVSSDVSKTRMIGMARVNSSLCVTLKFQDGVWKNTLRGVRSKQRFDTWWILEYVGQAASNDKGQYVLKIDYFRLRAAFVMPSKRLFDILSEELDKNFPKHECKERGAAIVLIAQAYIKICDELSKYVVKEPSIKEFLKRGIELLCEE